MSKLIKKLKEEDLKDSKVEISPQNLLNKFEVAGFYCLRIRQFLVKLIVATRQPVGQNSLP
jgi:hypothetical protein